MLTRHDIRRRAFSLVELLVAMALIIFIMAILSSAFAAASKAFRDLKAAGDLAEKLRGVMTMVRRDLMFPHFTGNTRLSSNDIWGNQQFPQPPTTGFFRIEQRGVPTQIPGTVLSGEVPTFINTTTAISFTARMPGSLPHQFFSTQLADNPPGTPDPLMARVTLLERDRRFMVAPNFHSDWAEIAYWVTPQFDSTGSQEFTTRESGPPQQLHVLRRRQRLLWNASGAPNLTVPASIPPNASTYPYAEISVPTPQNPVAATRVTPNTTAANSPINAPPYRFGMDIANPITGTVIPTTGNALSPTYAGSLIGGAYPNNRVEDIIATDVLSFDIRVLLHDGNAFVHLNHPTVRRFSGYVAGNANPFAFNNPAFRWDTGPWVFDTWRRGVIGRYQYGRVGNIFNFVEPGTYATMPLFRERNAQGRHFGPVIRIRAVKVTLRIWDPKTFSTRQVSMVQDL